MLIRKDIFINEIGELESVGAIYKKSSERSAIPALVVPKPW